MLNVDIGIDLGTDSLIIYAEGKGIVLEEPAVLAYDERKEKVVAVGRAAFDMLGKAPPHLRIVRPLEEGYISDFYMAEVLLKTILLKVFGNMLFKPSIAMCVPSTVTGIERSAFVTTALNAGARKVTLIEAPLAAAIGCGINFKEYKGNMVVNIGAGSTDIAVVSFGGVVSSVTERTGSYDMDNAIKEYVLKNKKLYIGQKTAETAKITAGTVFEPDENLVAPLKGLSAVTQLPATDKINSDEICEAISPVAERITKAIHALLEVTPPDLTGDILETGIILTGGGALLRGIDKFISVRLGVKVTLADDPIHCVAIGTGSCFKVADDLIDASFEHAEV